MGVALLAAAQERGASWPSDIDLWLLFWLLCAVAYAILVLVQRQNRTRAGLKTAVVWYLAAEFVNSLGWGLYCLPSPPCFRRFFRAAADLRPARMGGSAFCGAGPDHAAKPPGSQQTFLKQQQIPVFLHPRRFDSIACAGVLY